MVPMLKSDYCVIVGDPKSLSSIWILGGSGDLVTRLINPISHIVTPIIPIINLLAKSP